MSRRLGQKDSGGPPNLCALGSPLEGKGLNLGEPPQACHSQKGSDTRAKVAHDGLRAFHPGAVHNSDLLWAPRGLRQSRHCWCHFSSEGTEAWGGKGGLQDSILAAFTTLQGIRMLPGS